MSDIDFLSLGLGIGIVIVSLPAATRPEKLHNQSKRNRDNRLRELRAGAEEAFFEEQRALEAYTPHFNPTNQTLRIFGFIGCLLGLSAIYLGLAK